MPPRFAQAVREDPILDPEGCPFAFTTADRRPDGDRRTKHVRRQLYAGSSAAREGSGDGRATTVIPAVEGNHPRDRAHRAIAGHSMGGYGAMNLGLRHPDLFGQIVSIAGYYHIDDPDKMGGGTAAWAAGNSPDQHVAAGAGSRILLIADAQEHDRLIQGEAQRYLDLAQAAGQNPTFVVAPGGHTWAMVASQVPTIVNFLDAGW